MISFGSSNLNLKQDESSFLANMKLKSCENQKKTFFYKMIQFLKKIPGQKKLQKNFGIPSEQYHPYWGYIYI